MKIDILAIGDLKSSYKDMVQEYLKRMTWRINIRELHVKGHLSVEQQKMKESQALLSATQPNTYRLVLDERATSFSSLEFTELLKDAQLQGNTALTIYIGGSHGHADSLREKAHMSLSFGKMTWPHQLVRVMLIEQLYRAQQIMSGHPYHK